MTTVWGDATSQRPSQGVSRSQRRALGAAERRHWSSLVRQNDIDIVLSYLTDPQLYGAVVIGPRGVGKTTLAHSVASKLGPDTHVVKLFGSMASSDVPYSLFSVQLARLSERQRESPSAVMGALVEQLSHMSQGKPVVMVLDDLPGVDTLSMGILMQLVLSGKAKLLIAARSVADMPEDLVWMVKDGLLAQHRLGFFSRREVRELLVKALGGQVVESVVATLHTASAGSPLILQALVHEYLSSGVLRAQDGIWVPVGQLAGHSDDVLLEIVESRLRHETPEIRKSIELLSLLNNVPLALAMQILGADVLSVLEEKGFLSFAEGPQKSVAFAEPFFGETVRNNLEPAEKASLFQELSSVVNLDAAVLTQQELLMFASWINEAGMAMEPEVAISAAQAALHFFDPRLALSCVEHVTAGHHLTVQAAQLSSHAYYMLARYRKAAEVLEAVGEQASANLSTVDFASWAMDLSIALLWYPENGARVDEVLEETRSRICMVGDAESAEAEKFYNLARFEVHINRGEFTEVLHDLKIASKDTSDRSYRLNCASLLTVALAATGSGNDAVELAEAIHAETLVHDANLSMNGWQLYGQILGQLWAGQWRDCEASLLQKIEFSNTALHYRGGALELALGVVYAFAGKDMQAAEVLLSAAAQLELMNTYTSLELVYSTLAFVYSRLDDEAQSRRYLAQAKGAGPHVLWISRTLADYFRAMTLHSLGEKSGLERLIANAKQDLDVGRVTPALIGLLAAIRSGASGQYALLEQTAQGCQGDIAAICVLLAGANQQRQAGMALEAADRAHGLDLSEIEQHCLEVASDLAKSSSDGHLLKIAGHRMRGLARASSTESDWGSALLTPRELQIVRLAAKDMSNRDIAARIGVSIRTVEGHLYQVFAKLGISTRTELEGWVQQ